MLRTCDVCGWDTRSDTPVCAPCRRASRDTSTPDDPARGEQLLTALLQSAGGGVGSVDSGTAVPQSAPSLSPSSARSDTAVPDDGRTEQIVLREIESGSPPVTPVSGTASPTTATSVTGSLVKALTGGVTAPGPTTTAGPAAPPGDPSGLPHADVDDVIDLTDDTGNDAGGALSTTTEPDDDQTPLDRVRTTLREMGSWTTVAQLSLLIVGLLSVFQVVVLVVVLRFLRQVSELGTVETADVLAAHDRAMNSMLPVLVVCALAALALAIWCVRRAADRTPPTAGLLGVPVSLWAMTATIGVVVAVVAADTSATVEQASRMALLAIAACALLGATAFLAPRGIAVTPPDTESTESDAAAADAAAEAELSPA